jgi:hypothetical protein
MIELDLIDIFTLASLVFLIKVWTDNQVLKKRKPMMPPAPTINFESDILFLNWITEHKMKLTKSFLIDTLKISGQTMIADKDFDKYKDDIIADIHSSLSPNYKQTLYKYFTTESLVEYITELVFREMTVTSIETNFNFLRK